MKITKRRVLSVEDATARLDALARPYGISAPCYEESEADSMSEFDALKWTSLCSQRIALQQRENENASRDWPIPSILRSLYGNKPSSSSMKLENTDDGQLSLAA
jgi:phosphoketolase